MPCLCHVSVHFIKLRFGLDIFELNFCDVMLLGFCLNIGIIKKKNRNRIESEFFLPVV
jgi:hypothetical protein